MAVQKVTKSKFLTLDTKDKWRAFGLTVAGTFLATILGVLQTGGELNKQVLFTAIVGALSSALYGGKNLLTNSNDEFLKVEPKKQIIKKKRILNKSKK